MTDLAIYTPWSEKTKKEINNINLHTVVITLGSVPRAEHYFPWSRSKTKSDCYHQPNRIGITKILSV